MAAYLIENEGVLELDADTYTDVSVFDDEIALKGGQEFKNKDGRLDLLLTYSQECIGIAELKMGRLNYDHLKQLEGYLAQKEQILEKHPDIVNLEVNPQPKWVGVLVGSSISPELAEKISNGYSYFGAPIAALTIERFRGARGNVYVTTDVFFKKPNASNRDLTKYQFHGKTYNKGRVVLEVIKHHVEQNPNITFAELAKVFPQNTQGSSGVFVAEHAANKIYTDTRRKRHFIKPEELIQLGDETIAVCSQWGVGNIEKFLKVAKELGYELEPISNK
ncbi:MAG: hypothetical protein COB84_10620 [Rhodobacteraceae bacterium]|nr:MAG: hypothetical protein COB84_10620 [Paracoccaceae bacterium]